MGVELSVDEELLESARRIGRHKSQRAAVVAALNEYIRLRKQRGILKWAGKVEYFDDYDYKKIRRSRAR